MRATNQPQRPTKENDHFRKRQLNKRQLIALMLIVVVIALIHASLWLTPNNVFALMRLDHQNHLQQVQNERLAAKNVMVYQKVERLKHSNQAIEGIAREQLGLIQKGEQYYFVVYKKKE